MGWWYNEYPQSRPKRVTGGIQARSKRGDFGDTWWGQRWTGVLKDLGMGERLARGRRYARAGQVLNIDIEPGRVSANVQGSRPRPYAIEIRLRVFDEAERAALADALSTQPLVAGKLLGGELPEALEPLCTDAGLPLFPATAGDLETDCSCPDWANPCKHIAAVYCLLAEAFDDNPFLVLKLRGVDRETLTAHLTGGAIAAQPAPEPEPLPSDPDAFWQAPEPLPKPRPAAPPPIDAALLRRLGTFPFWRGSENLLDTLEPVYRQATQATQQALAEHEAERTAMSET